MRTHAKHDHGPWAVCRLLLFFLACGLISGQEAPQEKKWRIAVATFSHETCTFCPDPTTIEDWEYYGPP
ncbi:MAG: M81 family metallopeptidase, partial [Candidatus Aminicenantes bacterium]|nr:M81 family metallopeptidase [Candidatus Aminicenantes bacterium]